jgi:hypothetical protein
VRDFQFFEATREGVGYGHLAPVRVEMHGMQERVLCARDSFDDIALFRCPTKCRKPPATNDQDLYLALFPNLWSINGAEYRKLIGMRRVVPWPTWLPVAAHAYFLKAVGNWTMKDREKVLAEQYFCSELVVATLSAFGMTIVRNSSMSADQVSPNHLADPTHSTLEEVAGFASSADQGADLAPSAVLVTKQIVARVHSQRGIVKQTKELQVLNAAMQTALRRARGRG